MKPMVTTKKMLTWICILPEEGATNNASKIIHIIFSTLLIAITVFGFWTCYSLSSPNIYRRISPIACIIHGEKLYVLISRSKSLPWNQQTPFGCFWEIVYHIVVGEVYLFLNGTFLLFFVSLCLHHRAFYERFQFSERMG